MCVTVLYRDDVLLAVDKPSGLLVHRGWGRDKVVLVDLVMALTGSSTAHPLHRLDRQTSGVVLFALNAEVAKILGGAFEAGRVDKTYRALVRGRAPASGVIDHPIPRREGGPRVDAVTEFTRLETLRTEPRAVSWVFARPRTGRLHQVRRHLKHLSHPVIGDANYGKGDLNRAIRDRYGLFRLALHASSLTLEHPVRRETVTIRAPLPRDLREPLSRMGLARSFME
jgi:tRNA pseudouridine65 synthase